jgi:Lipase (class 3)
MLICKQQVSASSPVCQLQNTMLKIEELIPGSVNEFFTELKALPFAGAQVGDLGDAWFCAEASSLAYKEPAFIQNVDQKWATDGVAWSVRAFESSAMQAILLRSEEFVVLSFRGTRVASFPRFFEIPREPPLNLEDLGVDFRLLLTPSPTGGQIHAGFLSAFTTFWASHGNEIKEAIADRALFLTGHSLGGALSTVCASGVPFEPALPQVAALYTFGSPKVGDRGFEQVFEAKGLPVYRFVHGFDLVTTIPPDRCGYVHVGSIITIQEDTGRIGRGSQHSLFDSLVHSGLRFPRIVFTVGAQLGHILRNRFNEIVVPNVSLIEHAPRQYVTKLAAAALQRRTLP